MRDARPLRLALIGAGAVVLAGLATSISLLEGPGWAPAFGPADYLTIGLLAALCLALLLPLLAPPHKSPADWLTAGLLGAAAFAPVLVAGGKLAFADGRLHLSASLFVVTCWLGGSGLLFMLQQWTQRPGAHYLALVLAVCLVLPAIDFAGLELLSAPPLFESVSPVEQLIVEPQPR